MVARQPVRAGRLRRRREQDASAASCIDPVARRRLHPQLLPGCPTCRAPGFFNNNFISNGILNNDINQFDVRVDHNLGAGRDHAVRALQLPADTIGSSRRCSTIRSPRATSPATSSTAARTASAGWSRVFGVERVQRVPRLGYNRVRSDVVAPGVRHRRQQRSTASRGVPNDPRFYGGLPHMPIAALRAARRPVLPAAVPDLAGVPVRREPDLDRRAATR